MRDAAGVVEQLPDGDPVGVRPPWDELAERVVELQTIPLGQSDRQGCDERLRQARDRKRCAWCDRRSGPAIRHSRTCRPHCLARHQHRCGRAGQLVELTLLVQSCCQRLGERWLDPLFAGSVLTSSRVSATAPKERQHGEQSRHRTATRHIAKLRRSSSAMDAEQSQMSAGRDRGRRVGWRRESAAASAPTVPDGRARRRVQLGGAGVAVVLYSRRGAATSSTSGNGSSLLGRAPLSIARAQLRHGGLARARDARARRRRMERWWTRPVARRLVRGQRVRARRRLADGDAILVGRAMLLFAAASVGDSVATDTSTGVDAAARCRPRSAACCAALCRPLLDQAFAGPPSNREIAENGGELRAVRPIFTRCSSCSVWKKCRRTRSGLSSSAGHSSAVWCRSRVRRRGHARP